jgi:hypothetical protein
MYPSSKIINKFMGGLLSIEGNPQRGTLSGESIEKLSIKVYDILLHDH